MSQAALGRAATVADPESGSRRVPLNVTRGCSVASRACLTPLRELPSITLANLNFFSSLLKLIRHERRYDFLVPRTAA
jgi:hypothetical protein